MNVIPLPLKPIVRCRLYNNYFELEEQRYRMENERREPAPAWAMFAPFTAGIIAAALTHTFLTAVWR